MSPVWWKTLEIVAVMALIAAPGWIMYILWRKHDRSTR